MNDKCSSYKSGLENMTESTNIIINEVLDDIKENIDQSQQFEKLTINGK